MLILNRAPGRWEASVPSAMAEQSKAAIEIAFIDARHDILSLVALVRKLEAQLGKKRASLPTEPTT